MRTKFEIDTTDRSKKDEFFRKVRDTVPKAMVSGNTVDIDTSEESKIVFILNKTGVKFKKVA